jgi:dTDP-4-dehydrorhamnose reductase
MKLLVIGKTGQVAHSLCERATHFPDLEVKILGRPEIDLETTGSAAGAIALEKPDLVINAAAYTAVDQAETDRDGAFRINADAAGEIAAAAHEAGASLIHLSTDYVFGGDAAGPYTELAPTKPQNVYGQSKLAGEAAVRDANDRHLIIRTSWIYSPFGGNFVKTMMALADTRETIDVVDDQLGCPTSALELADAILAIAGRLPGKFGTYHLAGDGETSWYGFARAIMAERERLGLRQPVVRPVHSEAYATPVRRPKNSRLDCSAFEAAFGFRLPPWTEALRPAVERIARMHAI